MSPSCPDRDEFIWLDFNPQTGREQAGRRPAFVLSPRAYNILAGLCVVCPITSRVRGYAFEVMIPEGAAVAGVVLSDQVRSLSWSGRHAEAAGPAPEELGRIVRARISALIQF